MKICSNYSLFLALVLTPLLIACSKQRATSTPHGLAFVSIVDYDSRSPESASQDGVILKTVLTPEQQQGLEDVCSLASAHFPEGHWMNYGPDASYREIVISCDGTEYVLRSWHPLFEVNPNLVAASYGVTTLNGRTREQVLQQDDAAYVAQRNAFDEIERELRRRFGP